MNHLLQSFNETLNSPQQLHAAIVHLPIAAAVFGAIAVIALLCTAGKNNTLRWSAGVIFAFGAITGFMGEQTGDNAMRDIHPTVGEFTDRAQDDLYEHEEMGAKVWRFLAFTGVLVALSAVKKQWVRITALSLATLAAIGSGVFVGITAHYGGQLVYRHGTGVPASPNNKPAAEPPVTTQPTTNPV